MKSFMVELEAKVKEEFIFTKKLKLQLCFQKKLEEVKKKKKSWGKIFSKYMNEGEEKEPERLLHFFNVEKRF